MDLLSAMEGDISIPRLEVALLGGQGAGLPAELLRESVRKMAEEREG